MFLFRNSLSYQYQSIAPNIPLRKHAHAINRDFLTLEIEIFQLNYFGILLIVAQNINCGYTLEPPRRGGSNEYTQCICFSKNKINRNTPAYPFCYIKVGFKWVCITRTCFRYTPVIFKQVKKPRLLELDW